LPRQPRRGNVDAHGADGLAPCGGQGLREEPVLVGEWTIGPFGADGRPVGKTVGVASPRAAVRCETVDQILRTLRFIGDASRIRIG